MIKYILMDVEGTTTSIDFVHQTLFPYAAEKLPDFIRTHQGEDRIEAAIEAVQKTVQKEAQRALDLEGVIDQLLAWIKADRKEPTLKLLQGYVWKFGYEQGDYKGHVYEDVKPTWTKWKEQGLTLGIYSSGSVQAQQLLFGHSIAGDLRPFLSHHFDTKMGHKKEVGSYQNIREQLALPAAEILFISDVGAELKAAREAGFQTLQSVRPGVTHDVEFENVHDFTEIKI